jgi:hypothetical protein
MQVADQGASAMLSDTHPDAERVQIELIRKATPAQRIASMRSLTSMLVTLSRRGIAQANPGLTPEEVNLRWVELHYGKPLADELRMYLKKAAHES